MADLPSLFGTAALSVADLVGRIPDDAWSGSGLGEWDLLALVGHTSRSLVTVIEYLDRPAESEALRSAVEYCAMSRQAVAGGGAGVVQRGRDAGAALGQEPAARFRALADQAIVKAAAAPPDRLITTIGGGMRFGNYLPTRIFELAVHGLDIAAATRLSWEPPREVQESAAELAARVAVRLGQGAPLIRALTGRAALPDGFSVT